MFVKKFFKVLKNQKKEKKEWKEKSTVQHEEVGNIEKIIFVIFVRISKTK